MSDKESKRSLSLLSQHGTNLSSRQSAASQSFAALCGGIVGSVAHSIIMTPTGLLFTSLNVNKSKPGHENDTAISLAKDIVSKQGVQGVRDCL